MALLGRFIAEFLAPVQRLVVETIRTRADARRDAVLARAEYRVLRLDAELGVRNVQAALSRVSAALARKVEAGAEVGRRFCAAFATG